MLLLGIGWPGGSPENTAIVIVVVLGAYFGALWLAAVIWTARDIRDRSRDPVTQIVAVLIVLVLTLPGWALYLVLRPPTTLAELYERELEEQALLQDFTNQLVCPDCGLEVTEDYVVCPHCTARLKEPCSECGRALVFSWVACPWCAGQRRLAAPRAKGEAAEPLPSQQPRAIADPRPADAAALAGPSPFRRPAPAQPPADAVISSD